MKENKEEKQQQNKYEKGKTVNKFSLKQIFNVDTVRFVNQSFLMENNTSLPLL